MPTLDNIPPLLPFSLEALMFYGGVLGLIIGGMTLIKNLRRELSPRRHYQQLKARSRYGWRYVPHTTVSRPEVPASHAGPTPRLHNVHREARDVATDMTLQPPSSGERVRGQAS